MASEPLLKLGGNVELEENQNGEPVLRHKSSGAEFKYDSATDAWKPTASIDMAGNNVENVKSVRAAEIRTKENTGEVFVSEFDGGSLDEKLENALAYLDETRDRSGRIRLSPRADGKSWQWNSNVTIDTADIGVHLDIDDTAAIEYTGTGTCLTFEQGGTFTDGKTRAVVTGGRWRATGDPDIWCQLKDTTRAYIHPNYVNMGIKNGSTAVSIENHERWAESCRIRGKYRAGIGIDTKPVAVTGGTGGTDSFHGTTIEDVHIHASRVGIRMRGNWGYSQIRKPEIFLTDDRSTGFYIDSYSHRSATITSFKVEAPGGDQDISALTIGEQYGSWNNGALTIVGGDWPAEIDRIDDRAADGTNALFQVGARGASTFRVWNHIHNTVFEMDRQGNITTNTVDADGVHASGDVAAETIETTDSGFLGFPAVRIGDHGAGFFVDNGDVYVVDEEGTETQLT